MYSTELHEPGWRSMPFVLKAIVVVGLASGVVALWAAYAAESAANDAANDAAAAAEQAAVALDRAEVALERLERESLERDFTMCTNANETRAAIVTFVTGLVVEDGTDGVTPGEQVVLDFAASSFEAKECPPDPSP